jgi:hypothetical protein
MNIPSVALRFVDKLTGAINDELQQLVASIQVGFKAFTDAINIIDDPWIDVDFNVSNFSTNSAGSITPNNVNPYTYRYRVIGKVMFLICAFKITVNNGTTTELRFTIPGRGKYELKQLASISTADTNQQRSTGIFNGTGAAGVCGTFINVQNRYVSLQRWDGIPAAGYPMGDNFCGFQIVIPLL